MNAYKINTVQKIFAKSSFVYHTEVWLWTCMKTSPRKIIFIKKASYLSHFLGYPLSLFFVSFFLYCEFLFFYFSLIFILVISFILLHRGFLYLIFHYSILSLFLLDHYQRFCLILIISFVGSFILHWVFLYF